MNDLFISDTNNLQDDRGIFTSAEILRQPQTWDKVWRKIASQREEISSFLQNIISQDDLNIVLTGAGSSAFVGDLVASAWLNALSRNVQAIPTTDMVTHFEQRVIKEKPLLLVSFARSGNSPESTAAVRAAERECDRLYHLVITCNPDGKLAQLNQQGNAYVFLLPEEAEDQSLAMTNSFTSMALAAILIAKLGIYDDTYLNSQVQKLSLYGEALLENYRDQLQEVANTNFNRIIFLGSGPLWGTAEESHLKVQELTNGEVVGKFDSFLGFRHGPKAIINDQTLIIYLLSNNEETHQYEKDLIDQIAAHNFDLTTLAISETGFTSSNLDYNIKLNDSHQLDEEFWAVLCTLPSQLIGFYKSLALTYNPDNPSPDGTISRVVEGVRIYDGNNKPL